MKTEKEFLINLVNKTIEFLASKLKEKHKKDEELILYNLDNIISCFYDIHEDLMNIEQDWEHINYKLYIYFENEYLFAGNKTEDNDVYLSKHDIEDGAVQFYLKKACLFIRENYNQYLKPF